MTAWQTLSARLQGSSEDEGQEPRSDAEAWEQAPAPAKVAKLIADRLFQRELAAEHIPVLTQVMHWAYGTGWGPVYELARARRRPSTFVGGLVFGVAVWVASYVQLVPLGIYAPPWEYSPGEIGLDLSYHLVYGVGASASRAALDEL